MDTYLAERQIAELACYLALMGLTVIGSTILINYYGTIAAGETVASSPDSCITLTGREVYDRRLETRRGRLGYDIHGKPWYWPDKVRVMQGIVLGMTGSGKTTLLKNTIT